MKYRYLAPTLLAFVAATAFAQQPGQQPGQQQARDFEEVDRDANGELSVEEARGAFPELEFEGLDDSDALTRSDIEDEISGLSLGQGDEDSPVGRMEYQQIVQAMENEQERAASQAGASTDQPGTPGQ
ncbi:MAG: hypothetical protein WDZ76_13415 [Pseudohongiellaceae bacterium]